MNKSNYNENMVSVIVPCYHVSRFLPDIATDLQNQNIDNYEVLFVNDGDEDQTELLESICMQNPRFKTLYKKNGGLSSARNLGLDNAQGEWVVFVDPDDRISFDHLQKLYCSVSGNSVALGIGGYQVKDSTGTVVREENLDIKNTNNGVCSFRDYFDSTEDNVWLRSCWSKIYSRKIINQYNIRFDEKYKSTEDWKFNLSYYLHADKVALVQNSGYTYKWANEGSLIHSYVNDPVIARMIIIDQITLVRKHLGRSDQDIERHRKEDLAILCFEMIKNMFCGKGHPSLSQSIFIIRDQIVANKEMMTAVKNVSFSKKAYKLQQFIVNSHLPLFIGVTHYLLYKIHNS